MTIQEFFDKYNNIGVDFDGYFGFQCMDLIEQYNKEIYNGPRIGGNAINVWDSYPKDLYDKIENTPDGVPQLGDIVIWGVGVGQYGHIAIFDHGDTNSFTSFDQNWPLNSLSHYQNHNYNGVLGWLHPKNSEIITQPIAKMNDQTIIDLGEYGRYEVQAIRGFYADATNWKKDLDNANSANRVQADQIAQLQKDLADCGKELSKYNSKPYTGPKSADEPDFSMPIVSKVDQFLRWFFSKFK